MLNCKIQNGSALPQSHRPSLETLCTNSTFSLLAYWPVLVLETLESFRVKMAAASMHITEKISGEYACLTASSNMLLFLREELTNLPKMVRTAFGLPSRPPAKGCPARLRACVGVVKPCTRDVFVGMCMNAPFLAGATLLIVHLDRREVGGESEGYARCRRCRVASIL